MTNFPEFVNNDNTIDSSKVLTKVLTAPKRAFEFINTYKYDKHLHILLFLAGVSNGLTKASDKNMGDTTSLLWVLFTSVIIGGFFGWISFYIYSAMISWTGKWLNGFAKTDDVLRVFAYATLPTILGIVFIIIQIAVFGDRLFISEENYGNINTASNILFYGCAILQISFAVWSMVLLVLGVAEVQKFSIGNAILNVLLPSLILLAIIFAIVMLFIVVSN